MAALSYAEIEEQAVELLPVRTVLSAPGGGSHYFEGGAGGDAGPGGEGNTGGAGTGGPGGHADATVHDNYNEGFMQVNIAVAVGGPGGDGYGGDVHAGGGDGGGGGDGAESGGAESGGAESGGDAA